MVSTDLKNISQISSFPQVGLKIKHIWNHPLDDHCHDQNFPSQTSRGRNLHLQSCLVKGPPGTTRDKAWWFTQWCQGYLDVSKNSGVFPPNHPWIHRVFFIIFTIHFGVLGTPILGNTYFLSMAHYHAPQGGWWSSENFFSPRIPVTQVRFTCFVWRFLSCWKDHPPKKKRSTTPKSEGTRKHFASRANTIKVHVQDAVLSKITSEQLSCESFWRGSFRSDPSCWLSWALKYMDCLKKNDSQDLGTMGTTKKLENPNGSMPIPNTINFAVSFSTPYFSVEHFIPEANTSDSVL